MSAACDTHVCDVSIYPTGGVFGGGGSDGGWPMRNREMFTSPPLYTQLDPILILH